ncbi:uncharacterized protein SETTUDRAFT_166313 [Exserohilum turcica Et28A]|uniref:Uncharacterized protein n=1 Tax=Exserohilum turcicum (strain 28A) TaxID=671987 RepID=R0JX89_EXST2|nr:uncharacterized protein SETTUDRAFT_166313 [Exserohilum turcica Et28A]EOA80887.1 hypothetical protein SETTUDRAFT_166313 [Exserohilum turcica Et28A]
MCHFFKPTYMWTSGSPTHPHYSLLFPFPHAHSHTDTRTRPWWAGLTYRIYGVHTAPEIIRPSPRAVSHSRTHPTSPTPAKQEQKAV